ncbi:MAG: PilZ domain-containing protein [Candidatus Omnitrophica bacterium]|nr:PilZ domain-containing protein [Candidatus Omnitrophota bacterium]
MTKPSGALTTHEKRRHLRLECHLPLRISSGGSDFESQTKNISCSGAYCQLPQRLEIMTKLKVVFSLPAVAERQKKISCQAVVVRVQAASGGDYYDTAMFFNDIAPQDAHIIMILLRVR